MGRLIANIVLLRISYPLASSASPLLLQVDIDNIEHERQGDKVSILFAFLDITPETHLVMFDGSRVLFLGRSLHPELRGTPLSSSPRSIPIVKSCSEEGKVSNMFGLHCNSAETHLLMF
jgi:hypothetical protein